MNIYAPALSVIAQNGNIDFVGSNLELAPAATGQLTLIAAGSIYGAVTTAFGSSGPITDISLSGADPADQATPADPAILLVNLRTTSTIYTNISPNVANAGGGAVSFGADTPTFNLHPADQAPALVLAGVDLINVQFGQIRTFLSGEGVSPLIQYLAAEPFDIAAGQDIVASGSPADPSVFLNTGGNDVTSITAGRDILESSADIAGPGTLLVQAGRDVYQAGNGALNSVGPIFDINPDNRDGGAGITVIAGTGATGPDYTGFSNLYLNPASTLGLQDAAAIVTANDATLLTFLQADYGYTGTAAGAYAAFLALPANARDLFLLEIYFADLNQSGLEFNEPSSVRYKSYALGRNAIATLFPTKAADGQTITYNGAITLFGDSGIHTDFGGAIETLTPGGETVVGVEGTAPPGSAGIITEGTGNIDIYALDSVLLGQSRVLTTFGGNIVIWSAAGNINAGIGDKTTIDYTPLQIVYDNYGNIELSPTVPSSGAGIGTLNPIPSVAAGDINLIAPLGTVDAGEAGIRVSGNLNIAAAHVLNTANIQVQGATTGVPVSVSPNVGALSSAGNAAGAAAAAAESTSRPGGASPLPTIWIVEILGYGGATESPPVEHKKRKTQSI